MGVAVFGVHQILNSAPGLGWALALAGGAVAAYAGYKGSQITMDFEEFHRKRNAEHLAHTLQVAQAQGVKVTPTVVAAVAEQQKNDDEYWQKRAQAQQQAVSMSHD